MLSAGEPVGEIHIAAGERVELCKGRHALDVQGVDLVDQLPLEGLKLAAVAELVIALPVIQRGQELLHIGAGLLLGEVLAHHVPDADVQQIVHAAVGIDSVGIAPFAVILVETAVVIPADDRVLQRHAAALADQAARLAEQRVDRHAEQPREQLQRLGIGHGLPVFPARDRLPGHKDLFRQRVL